MKTRLRAIAGIAALLAVSTGTLGASYFVSWAPARIQDELEHFNYGVVRNTPGDTDTLPIGMTFTPQHQPSDLASPQDRPEQQQVF